MAGEEKYYCSDCGCEVEEGEDMCDYCFESDLEYGFTDEGAE